MTTHRSPLGTVLSLLHRSLVAALGVALCGLVSLALAEETKDASKTSADAKRVYTNADLAKYQAEDERNGVTKQPLPSQAATVGGGTKEDWSFVLAMIDREHEKAERSRAQADAAAAQYAADHQPEPEDIYGYAPYYGYGYGFNGSCVNGNCNDCSNGPFTHRSNCTPQQTNTMRPLDERGIRTPRDLSREASRNAAIHQAQVMPQNQGGVVMVGRTRPTPHR